MWRFLKILGFVLKSLFWLTLLLLMAGVAGLYVLERGLPTPLLRRLENAISDDERFVRIERATFSLKQGVRLHRVKAFPKRVAGQALAAIDEVTVDLDLSPGLAPAERARRNP